MSQDGLVRGFARHAVALQGSSQSQSASALHALDGGAIVDGAPAGGVALDDATALDESDADSEMGAELACATADEETSPSFCWLPHPIAARLDTMNAAMRLLIGVMYHTALSISVGCAAPAAPSVVDVTAPTQPVSAPGAQDTPKAVTVVWRSATDRARSPSGVASVLVDDLGKTLGERDEPILVVGEALFAIRDRAVPNVFCDCEACLGGAGCPDPMPGIMGELRAPVLVPLDSSAGSSVVELSAVVPSTRCESGEADETREFRPHSLVGPFLFGTVDRMFTGCLGAHPMWDSEPVALDVRTREGLMTAPPDSRLAAMRATAEEQLKDACVMDPDEKPQFWRGIAKLDAEGKVVGEYTFTKSAPYVCGTGPGHYSAATEVEDSEPPAFIAGVSAPRPLLPAVRRLSAIGFSASIRVERPGELDRVTRLFTGVEPTGARGAQPPENDTRTSTSRRPLAAFSNRGR